MRGLLVAAVLVAGVHGADAATATTVFLERGGMTVDRLDAGGEVTIPRFGGSAKTWAGVVACVQKQFAPFAIDVVDERPAAGTYITALIGGRAQQLVANAKNVVGLGGEGSPIVYVFSKSIGENRVDAICETVAHEVGHAFGLDHSMQCGDVMSYPRQECRNVANAFVDADAACGEYEERACSDGNETQNSFRKLASIVGLRDAEIEAQAPEPEYESEPEYANEPVTVEPEPELAPEPVEVETIEVAPERVERSPRRSGRRGGYRMRRWRVYIYYY